MHSGIALRAAGALSLAGVLLAGAAGLARADVRVPGDAPAAWRSECGSCHVAFPPQMLRAADWGRLMETLDRHFGADAAVSDAERTAIREFLERHAARESDTRRTAESGRITDSPYFKREHREIGEAVWSHADVKRASNCGACHENAEQGVFGHRVRMPAVAR
jgi:nitrate/TMAO reductase-like tetraheme cytochrome c subunit